MLVVAWPANSNYGRQASDILLLHSAGFRTGTGINDRGWFIINAAHLRTPLPERGEYNLKKHSF